MSEAGYPRNSDTAGNDWIKSSHSSIGRSRQYPWGAKNANLRGKDSGSGTGKGTPDLTVGRYEMKERPSVNKPEVFHMNVVRVADEVTQTIIRKQKDYGPNNIRKSPFGPLIGLTIRIYDKVARLANLSTSSRKPENESLRDTFLDIAGYGIIGLMILDETFPEE